MILSPIQKKKLFDYWDYKPGQKQWQAHESTKKFILIKGGNRSGKSRLAGMEGACSIQIPQQSIWCVAPTYDLANKVFRLVYDFGVIKMHLPLLLDRNNPPEFLSALQTHCWAKSTEKLQSLEAEGVNKMIVDEFGFMNKLIWHRLIVRLDQENSQCILIYTPKGKNQFIRELWNEKSQDSDWLCICMPTDEVEYANKEFLEIAEKELGGKDSPAYREQIKGEDVPYGSLMYPMITQENFKEMPIEKNQKLIIGSDIGFVHPCTADFWQISSGDKCYKFDEYHKTYTTQQDNAVAIIDKTALIMKQYDFKKAIIYYSPEEPSFGLELRKAKAKYTLNIIIQSANNAVEEGIDLMRRLLPSQINISPRCKNSIFNYQNYCHKPDSEDILKINDDHCDGDRYALYTYFNQPQFKGYYRGYL